MARRIHGEVDVPASWAGNRARNREVYQIKEQVGYVSHNVGESYTATFRIELVFF